MNSGSAIRFRHPLVSLRWVGLLLPLVFFAGCPHRPDGETAIAVLELTEASFHSEVMESDQPVMVEFWAPWCRPCLEMQPSIDQLARDFCGEVKVARINMDESHDLATSLGVDAPPVIVVFRAGKVIRRRSGKMSKPALRALILESAGRSGKTVMDAPVSFR